LSIFPEKNYIDDARVTAQSHHTAELRSALSRLIRSHEATAGCKPTEQQVNDIARQSGAAVTAIMLAMSKSCLAFAEVAH